MIFFAYIGFDAVSTAAQEAKKPQRDMPIGIIGSLAICTILYVAVLARAHRHGALHRTSRATRPRWRPSIAAVPYRLAADRVVIGIIAGYTSVILVMLLGQIARLLLHVARRPAAEGLLRHPPQVPDALALQPVLHGLRFSCSRGFLPISKLGHMTSIGTLLAFVIVCVGIIIMRKTHPNFPRPFRTPLVPLVPILGILVCLAMMVSLDVELAAAGRLARHRPGHLLRLQPPPQPSEHGEEE